MSDAQASGLPALTGPDPRLDMAPGPREALYVPATWNLTTTAANGIAGTGVLLHNLDQLAPAAVTPFRHCPMAGGPCQCAIKASLGPVADLEDGDEDFDDDGDGGGNESPQTNPRQPMRVDEPDRELVPV